jgi:PhzF family phenazine biosynthesis protein
LNVLRYVAFSATPEGGNPAGVVLDACGADGAVMLATAARVGYSETAFVTAVDGDTLDVRYFSPLMEVPFCGHATIALAAAYAQRNGAGSLSLRTSAGMVGVTTTESDGRFAAVLTSVPPRSTTLAEADLNALLRALRWSIDDLDPAVPAAVAFAGAWHPIVAVKSRERLAELDYDMAELAQLMGDRDWTTINLVWRESETVFHSRNPFPPGGIWEDPATGAAAAALGGYLRGSGLVDPPCTIVVRQGEDMGRPSVITVSIPQGSDGIGVCGTAVELTSSAP